MMPFPQRSGRPTGLAVFLTIAGIVGFVSSFALTLDKFEVLADPNAQLGCNFSILVQCGANLAAPQGSIFGFPNPLIGIVGFTAVTAVGIGVLAGARFAKWFWLFFNLGVVGALSFVVWLIGQSIYVLGTLCPWCMVVWAVTIPLFLAVTLYNVRASVIPLPARARRALGAAYSWIPFITVLSYIAIAVLAQLRLNVVQFL